MFQTTNQDLDTIAACFAGCPVHFAFAKSWQSGRRTRLEAQKKLHLFPSNGLKWVIEILRIPIV